MPNVISITDKIDHLQCLNNLGWGTVDAMTIGDPENYVLSPCCIHGYRIIWSPRPLLHWFRPTLADLSEGLRDGGPVFAAKDSAGSAGGVGASRGYRIRGVSGGAAIDTLGLGTWKTLETSGFNSWHGRNNKIEDEWNWTQEIGSEGYGGDRPEWFTPGRTIKGAGGSGTSWVLIDGFTGGTSPDDPPAQIQSKWWGTTQTDLSTVEEELNAQSGYNYVEGQQVTVVGTSAGGNENSGLGVSAELGPSVGGTNPLWVQYGPRTFLGITKCNDPSPHVHPGTNNWNGVGHFDSDIFADIAAGPSHTGGMTPEIVIYGGDVQGVRATPNITADGNIESFTITDPGSTVIGKDVVDMAAAQGTVGSEIVPPNITLSTPSSYYSGFAATVDVSSIFAELKAAHPDFFKTSQEVHDQVVDSYIDPIAQTFMINENYPDGIFLDSVDICFSDRPIWGEKTGVTLEIRPTVNGFPSAEHILTSKTIDEPTEVNIADGNASTAIRPWDNPNNQTVAGEILPNFNNENAYTRFKLPYPFHLESGNEYCFVVRSNDSNYKVWISDARVPIITSGMVANYESEGYEDIKPGTGRKQYGGSFFRSQNGRTWTPDQHLDIMFRLNKCVFPTNTTKTAILRAGMAEPTQFDYDRIKIDINSIKVPNEETTTLSGSLSTLGSGGSTEVSVGILDRTHEDETKDLTESMTVPASRTLASGPFKIAYDMTTTNRDVSPQIDTRNIFVTPIKNDIDNGTLTADDIVIINGGSSYSDVSPATFIVAPIGAPEGSVNAAFTLSDVGTDDITEITVTTAGSGFHKAGSGALVHQTGGAGTGAVFQIDSEEGRDSGNAKTRYVTKIINLSAGMEARHLRSFMTAHKPEGSSIYAYYKVLSAEDTEEMTDKKWKVMTQTSPDSDTFNGIVAGIGKQFSEFEFNSDEIITYSADDESVAIPPTYDTFKSFQIKIVLFAEDSTKVPVLKKFRTIAVY